MKEIPLLRGGVAIGVAIVDDEDYEASAKHKWHLHRGYAFRCVYDSRIHRSVVIYLHRAVLQTPDGVDTDHINGNKLDNRRENLRIATRGQNMHNAKKYVRKKTCTSRYKGVYWYKRCHKWMVQLQTGGKSVFIGYFSSEDDAARAYDAAAIQHFGEFAKTNVSIGLLPPPNTDN